MKRQLAIFLCGLQNIQVHHTTRQCFFRSTCPNMLFFPKKERAGRP